MAQQIYRTTVGNTAPNLVFTCERNSTVINVTGATVTLALRNERTNVTTNPIVQSCALTTPASGIVTYSPAITDFPTEDRYIGDVKIVYSTGKVEHLYELLLVIARGGIS